MKRKEAKQRLMDALAVYSSARAYGPFGGLQKKRERFEALRDLYEKKYGTIPYGGLGN